MAKGVINLQKESGGIVKISPVDGIGITEVTVPESGNLVSVDKAVTDNAIARFDGTTGKLQSSAVIIEDNGNILYGKYGRLLTGYNNTAQLGFNINSHNVTTDTYSPNFFGGNGAGMSIIRMSSGGLGGLDILTKISGTDSSEQSANTFNKFSFTDTGSFTINNSNGALGYGAGAGGTVTQLTSKSTAVTLNKPSGYIYMHNAALAAGASVSFTVYNSLLKAGSTVVLALGYTSAYKHSVDVVYSGSCVISIENKSVASRSEALPISFTIINGSLS